MSVGAGDGMAVWGRDVRGLARWRGTGLATLLRYLTAAGLALVALGSVACGKEAAAPPRPPVPVTVALAVRQAAPLEVQAVGTVEARSTVEVRARVGGEINRVHFQEGDEVKAGQVLFTIDPRAFQSALASAQARLSRDKVMADNATREAARYADLVEKDFVTKEQYDRAQAEARAAQAGLAADEAAVTDARLQLEYATVRSPISGRAGSVLVHAGNNVKANDVPLVVIHQLAPIDVRFPIPQQQLGAVRRHAAGGDLPVVAQETGGSAYSGKLTFIDNAVDPQTGTIGLKASFENVDRGLWPGQLVQVVLRLGNEEAVVAPEAAVQSGQQGDYVFVVKDDQTVESVPVKVARSGNGLAVIAEGLRGGETVVTDGQLRLTPGAKVAIKGQEAEPDARAGAAPSTAPAGHGGMATTAGASVPAAATASTTGAAGAKGATP